MSDTRQMRYDLETATRALRGSSWPGEMAQRMEEVAARIDGYAARIEATCQDCGHLNSAHTPASERCCWATCTCGDGDWDHLSDEQLDRLTAAEADTARGVLALLDRIEELEGRISTDEDHCVLDSPDEALSVLVAGGVLVERHMVPDSPHVAPGLERWRFVDDPETWLNPSTVYVRVDTLPPLIGEEDADDGE